MATKTYLALKTFIHEAYGWRLTVIELRNTSRQNIYGLEQNIYNILDSANNTDNNTVTTVTQVATMAENTAITLNTADTVQTNASNIIPPEIAAAINYLLSNQTAMMSWMAVLAFTPAPTQTTHRYVARKPFQVPPIQQLAIPTQQPSFQAGAFTAGCSAGRGGQGSSCGCGGCGRNPFANYMHTAGAQATNPGQLVPSGAMPMQSGLQQHQNPSHSSICK